MAFDYKKEYREFYLPPAKPTLVEVPAMNYVAVRGRGDPNGEDGEYRAAVGMLYAVAFTIKMSRRSGHELDGYFEYVVPPLEGFWWQEGVSGVDYSRKDGFNWISVIRLPEFVTEEDFRWAAAEAEKKKKLDLSKAEFLRYDEGRCVQCMHIGPYDDEPATVRAMHEFAAANGYGPDITPLRMHHEIYLSDPRRTDAARLRTVVRHPVKPL